jgi:hypothetical protein
MGRRVDTDSLIYSLGHCKCDGYTAHKFSQRRLTADWLAPRENDCSRMHSKVSSDRMQSYIKATRPVLEIFKMAGYFPDRPRTTCHKILFFYEYPTFEVLVFIHLVVCLTTGPKPLPKRVLHIVRSRASFFKWEYPLLSLKSSSSFLRLLPRLPVTSILPFIFPSISRCRRQFLRKMWVLVLSA